MDEPYSSIDCFLTSNANALYSMEGTVEPPSSSTVAIDDDALHAMETTDCLITFELNCVSFVGILQQGRNGLEVREMTDGKH